MATAIAATVALDRVTSLRVEPGTPVVLRGLVTSGIDGSAFDAASRRAGSTGATWQTGGLFDLASGGLRVVASRPERHEYTVAGTGSPGAACDAAGAESPCLVPRTAAIAHERLRTVREFVASAAGAFTVEASEPVPSEDGHGGPIISMLIIGVLAPLAAVAAAWVGRSALRRRRRTAIARVRTAARSALRATRADVGWRPLQPHIRAMVAQAVELDRARRACERELGRIDLAALEEKRSARASAAGPPSPADAEALRWVAAECDEADQLKADRTASIAGIERIESALRVMTLSMRERRGGFAGGAPRRGGDPVERAALELAYREQARAEVERAVGG